MYERNLHYDPCENSLKVWHLTFICLINGACVNAEVGNSC